ncbi:V-set and immunoglobulin domain-containing protein 10-like 2 [Xiphophorus maculatus]|uniref:V-set and immunoglobulin domain-containing protein 10-like 2 n=1 Tax=Xiphophorus maculatus TaxID=8083 RepID=UPI000C6D20AF|nr:V-set and immunoglobulin domain-containing protein 10-like 2 [Xiphophorus maculatus]
MVGPVTILPNTASISIEKLPLAAHGLFTCQAFYDIEHEPIVYYYYVHLTVQDGPDEPQINVIPFRITKHGYSALENETVSMYCEAQSNPGSQYIWFYNDSKIYTRPLLTINKILRSHTGNYTCMAQNSHLHTQSSKTLSLTVYYPPDGSPVCSVESALNHTALRLLCSWLGGFPSPSLNWTGDPTQAGQKQVDTGQQPRLTTNVMMLPSEKLNRNSSLFTCISLPQNRCVSPT